MTCAESLVWTVTGRLEKSRTSPLLCRKSTPKMTGLTRFSTTPKSWTSSRSPIFTGAWTLSRIFKGSPDTVTNCFGFMPVTEGIFGACDSTSSHTRDTDDLESKITSASTPPMLPLVMASLFLTAATTTTPGFIDVRVVHCPPRAPLGHFPNSSLV